MSKLPFIKDTFLKDEFWQALAGTSLTFENANAVLKEFAGINNADEAIVYNFMNRHEHLSAILNALNSNQENLISLSGFYGTGKTSLLKTVLLTLEQNVMFFYYECSAITNLDDLILSLYSYLSHVLSKEGIRSLSTKQSVDEKLINYLKNIKIPLIIIIDGFENLIQANSSGIDDEIQKFLQYLLSLDSIKLVLSGRRVILTGLEDNNSILKIKIGGLEEYQAVNIIKDHKINASEQTLSQAYEVTRGYPENIYCFINAIETLGFTPFDLLKEYSNIDESFDEYSLSKIYTITYAPLKKLLWFFATIRHPVKVKTLEKLELSLNLEDALSYLTSKLLLTYNNGFYYIKTPLRNTIYNNIPANEKIKLHNFLQKLYSEQIPQKIKERILQISRKLLHSEQYHHYMAFTKLKKELSSGGKKAIFFSEFYQSASSIKPKDEATSGKMDVVNFIGQPTSHHIETVGEIEIRDLDLDTLNDQIINDYSDQEIIIELSEEEKKLLRDKEEEKAKITYPVIEPINQEDPSFTEYCEIAGNYENEKQYDLALESYKKAHNIASESGDFRAISGISSAIGSVYHNMHKYDEAITYFGQSLSLYESTNDIFNANLVTLNIADIYNDSFKHDMALKYYLKIINSPPEYVGETGRIEALIGSADIYEYREEFDMAFKYYYEALNATISLKDLGNQANICFKIALMFDDMNDFKKALEYYQKNIDTSQDSNVNMYLSSSYSNIASIYEERDKKELALEYFHKSLEIDCLQENHEGEYRNLSRIGNIYLEQSQWDKAIDSFHKELKAAKLANDPYWVASSYLDIGDYYLTQNKYEKAIKSFIISRKSIGKAISTDSKEKIDRRFRQIINEIGSDRFNKIMESFKKKNG